MKNKKIIRFLFSAVILFATLTCYAFPFSHSNSESALNTNESQVTTLSTPLENSLLSSQSAPVPASSLTILGRSSFAHGLNKKHSGSGFLCNASSEFSFDNFYLNEVAQFALRSMQLHLAICVLRI